MKTGRLPSIVRRFVQSRPTSPALGHLEQVGEQRLLVVEVEDGVADHVRIVARAVAVRSDPMVPLGVVEVDDERTRPPDTQTPIPTRSYLRVHQVHVVAAVVRLLALEEEVRAEDGAVRVAGAAAEVLGPDVARVAGRAQPVAGVAADEVAALVADRELLGVRPGDLGADPASRA